MKLSRITLVLVAGMGVVLASTLRGGEDRRLQAMDETDFEYLGAEYDAKEDECKFIFQVKGQGTKTTIKIENKNDDENIDKQDHKVNCRLKRDEAKKNEDYGVELDVETAIFTSNVKYIDENGNAENSKAKVAWMNRPNGKKIKLSVWKPTGNPDPTPVCDKPYENKWRGGCGFSENDRSTTRPTGVLDYDEDTYVVNCPNDQPEPVYWIVGTSEDDCDKDKVCNCSVNGRQVTCTVLVYKEDQSEGCKNSQVNVALHALCC